MAYADLFDYPLNAEEVHRYLWGMSATCEHVALSLRSDDAAGSMLSYVQSYSQGYYTLPGREWIVDARRRRENTATALWARARQYGRLIAQLPFVRMAALTGSLAVGNVEPGADIDYLIITAAGRLWLCRAAVIALTLWAARRGDVICPNFFLSENRLAFKDRNFYTAHEFTQMIPLYGMDVYRQMQLSNPWVQHFLPNALGLPRMADRLHTHYVTRAASHEANGLLKRASEAALRTTPGGWVEEWEMRRKLRKFDQTHAHDPESSFGPDCCKGHFNHHMSRTLESLSFRLREIESRLMEQQRTEAIACGLAYE